MQPSIPEVKLALHSQRARSELGQLQRAWERTSAGQSGAILGIVGAAGSGKSRLLAAFAEHLAQRDVEVLSVRCRNRDWAPFSALKRLLDAHLTGLAALPAARRCELESRLRAAAGPLASRARVLSPQLAELFRDAPATIGEGDARHVFVAGMADFLAKYLEGGGRSVVAIDDVHWLDASSRLVLSRMLARLCPQGHVFVCCARDDADGRESLERFQAAVSPDLCDTLSLGPLRPSDANHLIAESLGLAWAPAQIVEPLLSLSDGTPGSVLELLRLTLERGLLQRNGLAWQLDTALLQRVRLPASSLALIARRLAKLDPNTLRVLHAAAVSRDAIDVDLVARVTSLERAEVHAVLERAVLTSLLEVDAHGSYGFVHDTIWEALLREVPEQTRCELHQQVAEALQKRGGQGADYEYALARHYAAGVLARDPVRVFETNKNAARRALDACDDALALSFLEPAQRAAELAGLYPGREVFVQLAETYLRTGDTQRSLAYFQRALVCSKPGFERAHVRGRIAWIHHFDANASACRDTLEVALAESSRAYPGETAASLAFAAGRWALGSLRRGCDDRVRALFGTARPSTASFEEAEALCQLYIELVRVALHNGKPIGAFASMLALASSSRELTVCRAVVHADLLIAYMCSNLGLTRIGRSRFVRAERLARELGDPIAQTLVHGIAHAISAFRGDHAESERQARLCVDERGHFMELGELCHVCFALYGIEVARGRPEAALAWIERAIERVRQHGRAPAVFALIEDAAFVTRITLGREREHRTLERRLRFVERAPLQRDGYFNILRYQTQVQRFTETGDLGPGFEALVAEFDALAVDPRRAHLPVAIYYLHVAHARLHQCVRAVGPARAGLLPKLARACDDLAAVRRIEGMLAHCHVLRASQHFFAGDFVAARRLLTDAEDIAEREGFPWASWAAARLRAHMLRAEGHEMAARDRARIAAMWAERHCQQSRLRFICEEFELDDLAPPETRGDAESPAARRNLDALFRISAANSRELGPERQARLILDELLVALQAERALLFIADGSGSGLMLAAGRRAADVADLAGDVGYDRALVEEVYATGQTQLADGAPGEFPSADRACMAVALALRERAVGVLYLDRAELEGNFRGDDAALLQALASQVSIALELGTALRERERLQEKLQQAKTMEAVGRLAGGIAHDFNNILAAIEYAAHSMVVAAERGEVSGADLEDIQAAAQRGGNLTRQLLGLSRGKSAPPPPSPIMLGDAVRALVPMLRRLVRPELRLALDIDPAPLAVLADLTQLERVLMNLCQNASDAMPHAGTITLRVAPLALASTGSAEEIGHVLLSVTDTGMGMNDEVRSRLFEPLFTTKSQQRGTGLGLANVYDIVRQYQGTIDVATELGAGSCFRIALPRCPAPEASPAPVRFLSDVRSVGGAAHGCKTILVVDDDDGVRRTVARTLELGGFHVLCASNGNAALQISAEHERAISLVVADMHMPGMHGSELARALFERDPGLKLLFLSGDTPDELAGCGLVDRDAAFLHKPFPPDALLAHVRRVLAEPSPAALRGSVG